MAQIKISNVSRRLVTLNLPHDSACSGDGCFCSRHKIGVQELDRATGAKTLRAMNRRLAGSLTLAAKGSDGDTAVVPGAVARAPDVAAAARAGVIVIAPAPADATPADDSPPPPPRARKQPPPPAAAADTAAKE